MKMKQMFLSAAAGLFLSAAPFAVAAEEITLRAVTFTPANVVYAQHFKEFADRVNERGKGIVQINIVGGPETIPMPRMGEAQKNGIADIFSLTPGLYLDLIPEGEAFAGSNKTPMENRASGALDTINEIFHEKANAHVLAHLDGGAGFHVFMTREPTLDSEGNLDLTGYRIRSAPLYRAFLEKLGATIVVQPAGEIYTSLERGVVDGNGYTVVGVRDFGWDKFLKYQINPGFFQTDVLVSLNYDSWKNLSQEARDLLNEVGQEYEKESYDIIQAETKAEQQALIDGGMQVVELEGAARAAYLETAFGATWARLKERDPTHYDALRAAFFDETK